MPTHTIHKITNTHHTSSKLPSKTKICSLTATQVGALQLRKRWEWYLRIVLSRCFSAFRGVSWFLGVSRNFLISRRFSQFLGVSRNFSQFLGISRSFFAVSRRFAEFLAESRRFAEFLAVSRRFMEFLAVSWLLGVSSPSLLHFSAFRTHTHILFIFPSVSFFSYTFFFSSSIFFLSSSFFSKLPSLSSPLSLFISLSVHFLFR